MSDDKKNPLGPAGERLRRRIAQLREERGLTKKQLSERVAELGRSIPPLGISRLEAGTRRVDADDLLALALALRVSVNALLLPTDGDGSTEVELTEQVSLSASEAWEWADGNKPHGKAQRDEYGDLLRYRIDSRPEWERDFIRATYNQMLEKTARHVALGKSEGEWTKEDGQWVLRSATGLELWRGPRPDEDA
jgi:transcriptional regulator with XRE-family HTH domain